MGERSVGCNFGWGKFFRSCCSRRANTAPSVYCREKNAGSSSSCSMLKPPACETPQRSGLPFDDKVQSRAAGPERH